MTLLKHATCYHIEFGRSKSNRMRLGAQRIWKRWAPLPLGYGAVITPRDTPLPSTCYTLPNLIPLDQISGSNRMDVSVDLITQ